MISSTWVLQQFISPTQRMGSWDFKSSVAPASFAIPGIMLSTGLGRHPPLPADGRTARPPSPARPKRWDDALSDKAINEFVQAGQGLGDELLDLASIVQQGGSADGIDPLTLRNRLDALTAQQAELLDKVLEDMENEELNAQLKAIMEEKQAILGRLGVLQQDEEQRAGQEARLRGLAEWLKLSAPMIK